MPSAYPGALDALTTASANSTPSTDTHPALHNDANSAINAIQETLGTNPQGSEASVAARLTTIEGSLGGGTLTVADVVITAVTQSSTYAGATSGTVSNMTDADGATGTGTSNGANEWIAVEWTAPKLIVGVRIGSGTITGFGATSGYNLPSATQRIYQYWDSVASAWRNWIVLSTELGPSSSGVEQFAAFSGLPVTTTKLRIYSPTSGVYHAVTEFVPLELKIA
jgi:hypothetical protein